MLAAAHVVTTTARLRNSPSVKESAMSDLKNKTLSRITTGAAGLVFLLFIIGAVP
jgi:hypothetical protein